MAKIIRIFLATWVIFLSGSVVSANFLTFDLPEICEISSGIRTYVDFKDSGEVKNSRNEEEFKNSCFITLVTCPSCSLKISWKFEDEAKQDFFSIVEPPYNVVEENTLTASVSEYVTKTRAVSLQFPPEATNTTFAIYYESQRNVVEIAENGGFRCFQSPFFPAMYSRDFSVDYNISCLSYDCRIRIIFTDYQLALVSTVEFFDVHGERFHVFSGAFFQPPVIFSEGSSMRMRFSANGGSDLGFRANVTFFSASETTNPLLNPSTNCGGSVASLGGVISMLNMVSDADDEIFYDCIWIVRPSHRYFHQQDQLLLRVDSFSMMGKPSELTVHRGVTSIHPQVLRLESEMNATDAVGQNLIVPISSGFYIHLRGFFKHQSRLVVVYAAFGVRECYIGTGFMCKNHRCIAIELRCDGFDQCGDGSDEPSSCLAENGSDWNNHPNYFFPKTDAFDDDNFRTVSMLLVLCSFGSVVIVIFFLLYRVNSHRARHQRNLQTHLQTISDLLVDILPDQNHSPTRDDIVEEPPPNYEAPPEYDDVIKVGMEYEIRRSKRRSRSHSTKRKHSHRKLLSRDGRDGGENGGPSCVPADVDEEILSIVTTTDNTVTPSISLSERFDSLDWSLQRLQKHLKRQAKRKGQRTAILHSTTSFCFQPNLQISNRRSSQ
ncbi:CUB domain [Sergentomyia squamirostris]